MSQNRVTKARTARRFAARMGGTFTCPHCRKRIQGVVHDSRWTIAAIRRRRSCERCRERFTTYERIEDGSRLLSAADLGTARHLVRSLTTLLKGDG